MRAAARFEDLCDGELDDRHAMPREFLIHARVARERQNAMIAERLEVAAVREDRFLRHGDHFDVHLFQARAEGFRQSVDVADREMVVDEVEAHVEVQIRLRPRHGQHLVAVRREAALDFLVAARIRAREHTERNRMLIEEHEVAALEEAFLDLDDDRHAELLHPRRVICVLLEAQRLAEASEDISLAHATAEVARKHRVRTVLIWFEKFRRDASVMVGFYNERVLREHLRDIQLRRPLAGDLIDRRGLQILRF